jgi:hypothetical protein
VRARKWLGLLRRRAALVVRAERNAARLLPQPACTACAAHHAAFARSKCSVTAYLLQARITCVRSPCQAKAPRAYRPSRRSGAGAFQPRESSRHAQRSIDFCHLCASLAAARARAAPAPGRAAGRMQPHAPRALAAPAAPQWPLRLTMRNPRRARHRRLAPRRHGPACLRLALCEAS